jgi:hypothetical protein
VSQTPHIGFIPNHFYKIQEKGWSYGYESLGILNRINSILRSKLSALLSATPNIAPPLSSRIIADCKLYFFSAVSELTETVTLRARGSQFLRRIVRRGVADPDPPDHVPLISRLPIIEL